MGTNPNIKRWGLFRTEGPHDAVRRYQLARLEEVSLAYPAPGNEPPRRQPVAAPEPLRETSPARDAGKRAA